MAFGRKSFFSTSTTQFFAPNYHNGHFKSRKGSENLLKKNFESKIALSTENFLSRWKRVVVTIKKDIFIGKKVLACVNSCVHSIKQNSF